MSERKRDATIILLRILEKAEETIVSTRLYMSTGLSYSNFQSKAAFLEEKGFLERVDPAPVKQRKKWNRKVRFRYRTSEKGRRLLRLIRDEPLLRELFGYYEWRRG